MHRSRMTLRKGLRNTLGQGLTLALVALVSPACALIAGFEDSDGKTEAPGSEPSVPEVPVDTTLPAAPRVDCGDVASNATNCGFCGHSCRGDACSGGLCAANVVVQATSVDAFVTDGDNLFTIDALSVRSCKASGPATQACNDVIVGTEVGPVLYPQQQQQEEEESYSWGWPQWGGSKQGSSSSNSTPTWLPLTPRALALRDGTLLVADDTYHVVIACPAVGKCDRENVALIDARMDSLATTLPFGRSLSVAPTGVAWSQGDSIRAASIPAPKQIIDRVVVRNAADTKATSRILTPAVADVFWLSQEGLYHSVDVNAEPARWFDRQGATDFTADDTSVYVASAAGIFHVARATHSATITASGAFEKVAVDGHVYATQNVGTETVLVEVRANDTLLPLARTQGPIDAIAIAGDYLYFSTRTVTGAEIRRVSR